MGFETNMTFLESVGSNILTLTAREDHLPKLSPCVPRSYKHHRASLKTNKKKCQGYMPPKLDIILAI